MANITKGRTTITTKYSGAYFRPVDTPVAKKGWYVDKITTECRPFEKADVYSKPILFATQEEAEVFARSKFLQLEYAK
ncbi:MAG: hypothetical protein ACLRFN_01570 [Alphaproteobacteria bacterium]